MFAQSYQHLELLLVDDGSAAKIQQRIYERYRLEKRCRLLTNKQHCGYPGAIRNLGIAACRGDYIAFLDSDDLWLPDKISRQLKQPAKFSHCREHWWRYRQSIETAVDGDFWQSQQRLLENGTIRLISQKKQYNRRCGDLFQDSLAKCIIGPSTALIERDFYQKYGGFREDLRIAEDYEFWLRLTSQTPVEYLDEPLVVKRDHPVDADQLSHQYDFIEKFRIEALRRLQDWPFFTVVQRQLLRCQLMQKLRIWANGSRKRGRIAEAECYEAEASGLAEKL